MPKNPKPLLDDIAPVISSNVNPDLNYKPGFLESNVNFLLFLIVIILIIIFGFFVFKLYIKITNSERNLMSLMSILNIPVKKKEPVKFEFTAKNKTEEAKQEAVVEKTITELPVNETEEEKIVEIKQQPVSNLEDIDEVEEEVEETDN